MKTLGYLLEIKQQDYGLVRSWKRKKEQQQKYDPTAVQKSIDSSRQKISGREAKLIHRLLKGRTIGEMLDHPDEVIRRAKAAVDALNKAGIEKHVVAALKRHIKSPTKDSDFHLRSWTGAAWAALHDKQYGRD